MFKLISDHIPIVITCGHMSSGPRPFRFFSVWYSDSELQNLVTNAWQDLDLNSPFPLCKFNQLRSKVRSWQSIKYSSFANKSKECEVETSLLNSPPSHDADELVAFFSKKKKLWIELKHLRLIKDQYWK